MILVLLCFEYLLVSSAVSFENLEPGFHRKLQNETFFQENQLFRLSTLSLTRKAVASPRVSFTPLKHQLASSSRSCFISDVETFSDDLPAASKTSEQKALGLLQEQSLHRYIGS